MVQYRVSVIIPTYKPGDYIWTCLDSINNQNICCNQYEVIIVLNGCKEPYESQIRDYIKKMKGSWRLIQVDQGGVSNARNIGIDNANGEYIAFIDDDDCVSQSYLTELLQVSSFDTVGLCRPLAFTDSIQKSVPFFITKEYDTKKTQNKVPFYIPRRLFAGPCMKLIHRSIIGDRRFDTRFRNSEDSLFMFAISDCIKWASFTSPEAVYFRRFRSGSAVTKSRSFLEKTINAHKIIWEETKIFWKNFPCYNFRFYITRILGAIRGVL